MSTEYSNAPQPGESTLAVDPDEVQRAKREIQAIVQQIAELSRTDIAVEQFYDEFLNKVVAALAAFGGAVWTVSGSGLQLTYQINLRQTGLLENPIGQEQHGRLLQKTLASSEGLLVAPHSGSAVGDDPSDDHAAANPTDYLLVLVPVHNDQGPQGVVEVFQRSGARPATQRGYLRFLQQTCDIAGEFLRGRRLRHLAEKQTLWEQLETFTRTAHETLDVREAAYTIANEGRRLIGCDRVSVAIQRGSRCTVEAVSGQDTFDKRSNVVALLNRLARAVAKTGEDVWYTGDTSDLAPQVERALDEYVDEANTKAMAILPLFKPQRDAQEGGANEHRRREVIGALIVEQMVDTTPADGFTQRVDVVRTHSATAIANALEHQSLFLMPLWKTLGKATSLFRGRTLWKTLAVIAAVVGLVVGGIYYPKDFNLEGQGRLKPVKLQNVFARMDGEISAVHVGYNDQVTAGQLLFEQTNRDLEREIRKLQGELSEIDEQIIAVSAEQRSSRLTSVEQVELSSRLSELRTRRNNQQAQIAKREEQMQLLRVTSPIDGRVITGKSQIEQLINRPITRGQALVEVADLTDDWFLEVLMPESRMRFVTEAWNKAQQAGDRLTVQFYLATQPAELFTGYVETIETTAEARGDEGNTVLLRVVFEDGELARLREIIGGDPKVGTQAIAKVHCGQRSIGYVYLHDLIDFFQAKVLFRLW